MNDKNQVKGRIKKVLEEHPEGLHILAIARLLKVHRHTATKYIHEMMGAGVIYQRDFGTIKICHLSPEFVETSIKAKRLRR